MSFEHMSSGQPRQRLGPAERGAFAVRIARGFAPGRQQVDALLGLSLRILCVHIDAVAQPLIWEARISTSRMRVGSRLEATASDAAVHFFMSSGAAARRSLTVMICFLLLGSNIMDFCWVSTS